MRRAATGTDYNGVGSNTVRRNGPAMSDRSIKAFSCRNVSRRFLLTSAAAFTAGIVCAKSRVLANDGVSWLEEIQRAPAKMPPAARLSPLLVDEQGTVIDTRAAWEKQRPRLLKKWQTFLGELDAKRTAAPKLTVLAEDRIDGVIRQRVQYEVEPGLTTEAYLLRPAETASVKRPGVVVFHSTVDHSIDQPAGVQGEAAKAFGLQLARQGFVTFCPRNYLWPDNNHLKAKVEAERFIKRQPQCLGMAKMLYDGQVALDILAAQTDVDTARLGTVGHSLGAKEALYLAAFDERVKATVSSEGGIGITFSNWHDAWYLGPKVKEPGFALEHHELLALVAPRAFLLVGGDSADGDKSWPFIEAALPVYRLYDERPALGLFNHKQGHSVPPEVVERIGQWCKAYL